MMMMMKQLGFLLYCVTPGDLGPAEGSTGVYPGSHLVLAEVIDYHPPHTHPPPTSHPPPPTHHPPPATRHPGDTATRITRAALCMGRPANGVQRCVWCGVQVVVVVCISFFPNVFTLTINLFN